VRKDVNKDAVQGAVVIEVKNVRKPADKTAAGIHLTVDSESEGIAPDAGNGFLHAFDQITAEFRLRFQPDDRLLKVAKIERVIFDSGPCQ